MNYTYALILKLVMTIAKIKAAIRMTSWISPIWGLLGHRSLIASIVCQQKFSLMLFISFAHLL